MAVKVLALVVETPINLQPPTGPQRRTEDFLPRRVATELASLVVSESRRRFNVMSNLT